MNTIADKILFRSGRISTILVLVLLMGFSTMAQESISPDYNQLVVNADNLLKEGKLDDARQAIQQAIKINNTNYLAYAVAAKIASKQNDADEANNFLQKALELAPDEDEDKIRHLAQQIQSATPASSTPAESQMQSPTPAPLSDDDQLKHDGLMQILEDAAKSDSDDDRKDFYRQFLTRSVEFADAHPEQMDIWVGRAYAAMQLDYPDTGWLAGKRLKALGTIHSDDSKLHDVMVHLESKGWLDDTCPHRDWNNWTTDQAKAAGNQGDADAQDWLGNWYSGQCAGISSPSDSKGQPGFFGQDPTQAISWYQKSADQGYADAQWILGIMYENGQGVAQDTGQALNWYLKAGAQGEPEAQRMAGDMYKYGWGCVQDYIQAVDWYRRAAEEGYSLGETSLGDMYRKGLGVQKDYVQALEWYRKAAEQSDAYGQVELGWVYENGLGVTTNYQEAIKWYRKAADQGSLFGQYSIAWLLSTCSDPSVRNGQEAVRYAEEAVSATHGYDPHPFDALAAAYAETGDFDRAISAEKSAIALMSYEPTKKDYNSRLSLYEANTPSRKDSNPSIQ